MEHSPAITLRRIRTIPDRFRFRGRWQAAIASQRSTFILWDRSSGDPVIPLISWRDRRGEPWIRSMTEDQFELVRSITGLRPEAGYPLSKIRWFLDRDESIREKAEGGELCFGSLDTWLLWVGSGGSLHKMIPSQAHRTLLYDPVEDRWSEKLMKEFDIPRSLFPEILHSIDEPIPSETLWPNSSIVSLIADQPAATIGGQPPPYSKTRVTLGTAGFVASPCEPGDCPPGLTVTFTPTPRERVYQAAGVVLSAGRAVDWLTKMLGVNRTMIHHWVRPPWPEDLPLWCPALNGVGAPFWSDRPASMTHFTEDTSAKQISLGLVVSVLFRVQDILSELPDQRDLRILLDGGLSRLDYVPPLAASLWDLPTAKTLTPHLTARGAVIASHWSHPYFQGNPWDALNVEVVMPETDAPVEPWRERWKECLEDWSLTPVQ